MNSEITVHFLQHSGFAVETGSSLLIFDYYQDEKNIVPSLINKYKQVFIFSSHSHYDHFDSKIGAFAAQTTAYFLSSDIKSCPEASKLPSAKTVYLDTYDAYQSAELKVTTYSSTDAGTSFLVELDGIRLFHAGDFNWWHWKGDTELNNKFARNGFKKQMKRLAGMKADVAFFPTDSRLEEFAGLGAKEFCRQCQIGYLIGMHAHGVSWQPEEDFFAEGAVIPTWCPITPGEQRTIIIRGEDK